MAGIATPGAKSDLYLVLLAIIVLSTVATAACLVIFAIRPDKDNGTVYGVIWTGIAPTVMFLLNYTRSLKNEQAIKDNTAVTIESSDRTAAAVHNAKEEVKQQVESVKEDVAVASTAAANAATAAATAAEVAVSVASANSKNP